MTNDNTPKKRRGAPPPKGIEARKHSGSLCTATRRDGTPCTNFAILGAVVCRMHGGAAPQVRRAAQVRLAMQADALMSALLDIALNKKIPVQHRLVAIRDGLDRADLGAKASMEITVEKGKSFENYVEEALVDVDVIDELDVDNIEDAVVVSDPLPIAAPVEDEPLRNRRDAAVFRDADRAQERKPLRRPAAMTNEERTRLEAVLIEQAGHSARADEAPAGRMTREQILLAKEAGTYNPSSRGDAVREAGARRRRDGGTSRQSTAKFGR